MWEKEKAAYAAGKRIQVSITGDNWSAFAPGNSPTWVLGCLYRIHPDDQEKESNMQQFKVGDQVVYVGSLAKDWPARGVGTVERVDDRKDGSQYVYVGWDTRLKGNASGNRWMHIPNDMQVAEALKVLQAAGKVTFYPNKPPFATLFVPLNVSYTANVSDKNVTVGCQTFSFDKVEELYAAVQKAREYNKEGAG